MKEKILTAIQFIQSEREKAHIVPSHVLVSEIINLGYLNPYETLNELVKEGKINWCRTLNSTAFTINKKP